MFLVHCQRAPYHWFLSTLTKHHTVKHSFISSIYKQHHLKTCNNDSKNVASRKVKGFISGYGYSAIPRVEDCVFVSVRGETGMWWFKGFSCISASFGPEPGWRLIFCMEVQKACSSTFHLVQLKATHSFIPRRTKHIHMVPFVQSHLPTT